MPSVCPELVGRRDGATALRSADNVAFEASRPPPDDEPVDVIVFPENAQAGFSNPGRLFRQ
jgi:predicted amidohydrolase